MNETILAWGLWMTRDHRDRFLGWFPSAAEAARVMARESREARERGDRVTFNLQESKVEARRVAAVS